jgi:c-di-GMP-binding flagellar brake protein YcgR
MLRQLQERNGGVDVACFSDEDDARDDGLERLETAPLRSRVLACALDRIVLERPSSPAAVGRFHKGQLVRFRLIDGDLRLDCICPILAQQNFALNARVNLTAFVLGAPSRVESAQRRQYFRVNVAGFVNPPHVHQRQGEAAVMLRPRISAQDLLRLQENHAHLELDAFRVHLHNISGGGVGVVAPQRASELVQRFLDYELLLTLPTFDDTILIPVRQVHRRRRDNGTHYLGLMFLFEDVQQRTQVVNEICRFTTWHQRRQLQRGSARR